MDTQALQAFVAIVDQGSFSAAAEHLHLTQPAISKRLNVLEQQLGHTLLERRQRGVQLTDAGRQLLPHARRILDDIHNARQQLAGLDTHISGSLALIASHHIGLHHLPAWLRRYSKTYPMVDLALQFMESEQALRELHKQDAELAFITLSEAVDERFTVYVEWEDPMCLVCGKDHALASLPNPTLEDLARHQALLPAIHTETGRLIQRLFLQRGLHLQAQMPTNLLETIKMMVNVGLGWSVMPVSMLDEGLCRLPLDLPLSRRLGGVGLRRRTPGRAATALLDIARHLEVQTAASPAQPLSAANTSAMR